jgi:hypothetical protein
VETKTTAGTTAYAIRSGCFRSGESWTGNKWIDETKKCYDKNGNEMPSSLAASAEVCTKLFYSMKVGCTANGTDTQIQLYKGKDFYTPDCAAGFESSDAEGEKFFGTGKPALKIFASNWVVDKTIATLSTRLLSTCFGGVQHADTAAAEAAAAGAAAADLSDELSAGSTLSVELFAGVLFIAAAFHAALATCNVL